MSRANINGFFSAIDVRICFTLDGTCVNLAACVFAFVVVHLFPFLFSFDFSASPRECLHSVRLLHMNFTT